MLSEICAHELADVVTDIFSLSLLLSVVPSSFKRTTIIPKTMTHNVNFLNDCCPQALTSIVMKCFESIVKAHITSSLPATLDPFQFAYRPADSNITLHTAISHLDHNNTYMRMLFADCSSIFNTMILSRLIMKFWDLPMSSSAA